jgi:archaellum component FlaC
VKSHSIQRLVTFTLCIVGAAAIGCKSSGQSGESESAVSTMKETAATLDQAKKEVNDVVAAMDKLSAPGDLKKSFENYHKQVAEITSAGERASARWKSMKAKQQEWTKKWESEAAAMTNPDVKKSMDERRQVVRDSFTKVEASAGEVKSAYQPFLKDVKEIEKALSLNLSTPTVQSLQPAMTKAKESSVVLNQKIDALSATVKDLMSGITPPAPPKS